MVPAELTSASAARNLTSRCESVRPRNSVGFARTPEAFPGSTIARSRTNHVDPRQFVKYIDRYAGCPLDIARAAAARNSSRSSPTN